MTNHEADPVRTIENLIDQLVDGGMTPDELRKAVERLDATPEGWRRCTLAFLEAQSWAEAFRSMEGSCFTTAPRTSAGTQAQSFSILRLVPIPLGAASRRRVFAGALAAGIALFAFSLGWLGHGVRMRSNLDRNAPPGLASDSKTAEPHPSEIHLETSPPESMEPGSIAGLPADHLPTVREVARLRFGTGDPASAEVPIFAGPGVSQRWLLEQPPPVSEHDRAIWRRAGYELEQHRRLLSVPLDNGWRATVPVDHVQVRYVGQVPL